MTLENLTVLLIIIGGFSLGKLLGRIEDKNKKKN